MENPDCEGIIRNAWTDRRLRDSVGSVEPKLTNSGRHLIIWSITKFSNNKVDLRKAKERLRLLAQSNHDESVQTEEKDVRNRIKDLWKHEELYWKQRARAN